MDFIKDFKNKNNNYTQKIKDSRFFEQKETITKGFHDICEIMISKYEINYSLMNDNEKSKFILDTKLSIANSLDEINMKEKYNRKFTNSLIMKGLQDTNIFSSILYLNEYYNCNCIIYNNDTDKYYRTGLKNNEEIFCEFKNNSWFLIENKDNIKFVNDINELSNIITMDINTNMIYKLYLQNISKYKVSELQTIATELNIPLNNNGKKKTKQDLYNEINLKKIL
jgi:hypothetical protein